MSHKGARDKKGATKKPRKRGKAPRKELARPSGRGPGRPPAPAQAQGKAKLKTGDVDHKGLGLVDFTNPDQVKAKANEILAAVMASVRPGNRHVSDQAIIDALFSQGGNISAAAKVLCVNRKTITRRMAENPDIVEARDEAAETLLDTAENVVAQEIKKHNVTMTIFFLKTKGKKRGYIERSEIGVDGNEIANLFREADKAEAQAGSGK